MKVILQTHSTMETRSISQYAAISEGIEIIRQNYQGNLLKNLQSDLKEGAMPVGSVDFVKTAFELIGMEPPAFNAYDNCIRETMWGRKIWQTEVLDAFCSPPIFIKPIQLKRFNGFVYKGDEHDGYDEHDREQLQILDSSFSPFDKVYVSEVMDFIAEWRCYITNGELIAICRYDNNELDHDVDMAFVNEIVACVPERTIAVDIGKTKNGHFLVVELNDAWAIGKYQGINNKDYFDFLYTRWRQIIAES